MITQDTHPTPSELEVLLRGELDEAETQHFFRHLETCPQCLDSCEEIWARASPVKGETGPTLDEATATKIERALLNNVRRLDLADRITELGSHGLGVVWLGLLQPILAFLSIFLHPSKRRDS